MLTDPWGTPALRSTSPPGGALWSTSRFFPGGGRGRVRRGWARAGGAGPEKRPGPCGGRTPRKGRDPGEGGWTPGKGRTGGRGGEPRGSRAGMHGARRGRGRPRPGTTRGSRAGSGQTSFPAWALPAAAPGEGGNRTMRLAAHPAPCSAEGPRGDGPSPGPEGPAGRDPRLRAPALLLSSGHREGPSEIEPHGSALQGPGLGGPRWTGPGVTTGSGDAAPEAAREAPCWVAGRRVPAGLRARGLNPGTCARPARREDPGVKYVSVPSRPDPHPD